MTNKKALITGASSGIGHAFAKELGKEGYQTTCVSRNEERLRKVVAELGKQHRLIAADLSSDEGTTKVEQELATAEYSLLINSAGFGVYDRFEKISFEKQQQMINLNVTALVRLSYAFLQQSKRGDALINVSSALSRLSFPGGATYCGTKGFVTAFTESLWYEYKDRDVFVMALLPGYTTSNFHTIALAGNTAKFNNSLEYPPETVVSETMSALKRRTQPSLISGPRYRALTFLANFLLSRKKMIEMMGRRAPGLS